MATDNAESGLAPIHGARIYHEVAGEGQPFVMIHAGVADCRQWNNEFAYVRRHYRVLRYGMRAYISSASLVTLAIISLFTGFGVAFLPYKLYPFMGSPRS